MPNPLPRRSTLVRKRADDDEPQTPSSPAKRAKVTFDSDVEVRTVGEWEKAPDLIQEEVRIAFQNRAWGDNSGYHKMKDVYSKNRKDDEDEPSSATLKNYTIALLGKVSSLNKSTSDLVQSIIDCEWLGRQDYYVSLHLRLLANVVAGQGMFLGDTLRMLVENLTASPPSNGRLPNQPPVSRAKIYARAHQSLQHLVQLVPSASRVLSTVLVSVFPHQTESRRAHVIYVQNLLKMLGYAPELRSDILSLITERLVKIDVQVQIDLEDLAEEVGEGLVQSIPQIRPDLLEDDEDSESSEEESDSEDEEDEDAQRTKEITRNVEKMDAIMDVLFSYYNHTSSKSKSESQPGVLEILLSQFVNIVLPTQRSRHTQFLLFHFAQQSRTSIDIFVGTCAQITFDRGQPAVVRQAAAAYLASFVARGIHVPSDIVREVFDYIGLELERFRREYEPACKGPNLRRYSSFYCLVQALLYMFCFRWRDLESTPEDDDDDDDDDDPATAYGQEHHWRSGVREALSLNVFSKLNPLKVCSPAIVTEFARIANHLGAVYVFHLLETNKRLRISQFLTGAASSSYNYDGPDRETALSVSKDESHQHLDAYFPFDPYHLPKSKRWIEGDYRAWTGIPGLDDEEAAESGSEEEDGGQSDVDEGTETEASL